MTPPLSPSELEEAAAVWRKLQARIPREEFLPDRIWSHDRGRLGNDLVPVDRRIDPDRWNALAAADEPVITQVDHGCADADGAGFEATSSSSDRRVVARMLALLDPQPGESVLEIGTGTGWNAALLATVATVTSVEIDPELAERARAALGDRPDVSVVVTDGVDGRPAGAPYDRIIATVGVETVPPAWLAQVRDGGRIVVPLTDTYQPPGVAVLTVAGGAATGRLGTPASFMGLRGRTPPRCAGSAVTAPAHHGVTVLHPYRWAGDPDATIAIGLRTSGISRVWRSHGARTGIQWLYAGPSRASVTVETTHPPYRVEQAGPRRLFDEIHEAHHWWQEQGSPTAADWTVVADATGTRLEL